MGLVIGWAACEQEPPEPARITAAHPIVERLRVAT
jgi:hypothetical protein